MKHLILLKIMKVQDLYYDRYKPQEPSFHIENNKNTYLFGTQLLNPE